MSRSGDTEEQLLEAVNNNDLSNNLAMFRQVTEKIWSIDAPRIIRDYTDHGIEHSQRLIGFAAKLLQANYGSNLSSQEMYLLLAGIYLHDIGMQCDINNFPEIKARAEELGAEFETEFTAQTASGYSIDEQKAIRKNHQYLTAAWIDYAHRTGETVLGPAAKMIPTELVGDLMDVCKYHARLPIMDCPLWFKFDPNERKQLVAAILRFADELDVDGNRVSIETVRNFRLDPRNAVYWWLHNRTKVVFSSRSLILLTVRLHPDDAKYLGSFVHNAFITKFQSKNLPVLSVLARNNIPIVISHDSKVVGDDYTEPLPSDIVQALQAMQERPDPLTELANEVRTWLQAIGYEVREPQQRDGATVDMLVTLDIGPVKQRVLVRCIGGEITNKDVDKLDKVLDRRVPQGWLISDIRVSESARERAAEDDSFQVFNLSEFLQQMVWGPYLDLLKSLVERDRIPDLYVDLACYRQEMDDEGNEIGRDRYDSLDKYIDEWLAERGKVHISLLGEFGAGKTWFCRHYAYYQLKKYLKDPANKRLPLLITLRDFTKATTAEQLINNALLEQYKLPFVGSAFWVFQEMSRRGKLLLILDGFDEMARQVDYQTIVDNFWELARLIEDNSKVILTSRTEYFRWAKESEKILRGEELARHVILLSPPKFEVLHLEPFNDNQVREIITRRLGEKDGITVAENILKTPNLVGMAYKPVLVELLLAALNEVSADVLENPAHVYLYATNKLLLRNIETKRTFTTTADKLYFLCELAWEMIKSGKLRVHYKDIPERIKIYFSDQIKDQHELDNWDFDLRSQTLLHRNAAGYYEFANKSLAEYFVAYKFSAELSCLTPSFAQAYCEADGRPCKIPIEQKNIFELAETFGAIPLTDGRMYAIGDLLLGMLAEDVTKRLWEVIDETEGETPEEVQFVGGNAATLLNWKHELFRDTKMARTVLSGADLSGADLTGANLQGAYLFKADLSGCKLQNVDLRGANLTDARFGEIGKVRSVAFNIKGDLLAAATAYGLKIWDIPSGKLILDTIGPHQSYLRDVQFSPTGDTIAAASRDGVISVWSTRDFRLLSEISLLGNDEVHRIAYHPDGLHIATGCAPHSSVGIIDLQTRNIRQMQGGHRSPVTTLQFTQDGAYLMSGSEDGTIRGWIVQNGKSDFVLTSDFDRTVNNIVFSPIEISFAVASLIRCIRIYSTKTRKLICRLPTKGIVWSVAYSPDGNLIAGTDRYQIKLWNANTYSHLHTLKNAHEDWIRRVIFSPDGLLLASGSKDATIKVWDVRPFVRRSGEPHINMVEYTPPDLSSISDDSSTWPEWWQKCRADVPKEMVPNPDFGKCLRTIEQKLNCEGLLLARARGLDAPAPAGRGNLGTWLVNRGARLQDPP